jgi:topoisomerase-4 subunit B
MAIEFGQGLVVAEMKKPDKSDEHSGTVVAFEPDAAIFGQYAWNLEFVEAMLRNYAYLNTGLTLSLNGSKFKSKNGLLDLLEENLAGRETPLYPIIHLSDHDIDVAFTHTEQSGEEYYSFVNGQHTTMGGTHLSAFREAIVNTIRNYYKKQFEAGDIRSGIVAADQRAGGGSHLRVADQNQARLDPHGARANRSAPSSAISSASTSTTTSTAPRRAAGHARQDPAVRARAEGAEGHQEAGQGALEAVEAAQQEAPRLPRPLRFNHKHKEQWHPLHHRGRLGERLDHEVARRRHPGRLLPARQAAQLLRDDAEDRYQNEEFNSCRPRSDIEEDLEGLRYNKVVIATDADVDGMHIRLLTITFFLQFFPDLIRDGHLYILETPLFRVRNKNRRPATAIPTRSASAPAPR